MRNELFLEELDLVITNEIVSDDECPEKKSSQLINLYMEHQEIVDKVFMALCGWKFETLMEKANSNI